MTVRLLRGKNISFMFLLDKVEYITPNKGHLFVKTAFNTENVKPSAYYEEVQEGMFQCHYAGENK